MFHSCKINAMLIKVNELQIEELAALCVNEGRVFPRNHSETEQHPNHCLYTFLKLGKNKSVPELPVVEGKSELSGGNGSAEHHKLEALLLGVILQK